LYAGAKVRKFENEDNGDPQLSRQIYNQLSEVFQILNISKKLKPVELFETYQIGHYLGFNLEEEYQLLSIPSEYDRQIVVLHQLQKILPNVKMTASIKRKALMNGEFREIIPPEI
jgi:Leu/Phe-tRNA-protein transferase